MDVFCCFGAEIPIASQTLLVLGALIVHLCILFSPFIKHVYSENMLFVQLLDIRVCLFNFLSILLF